ncbi:F-box domain-containing protein [Nemania sp. FL0031]|nr:F-box domain-containing protein [Nemania sp. FL0031]
MPYQDTSMDVLSLLSHRPRALLYSMITISDPPEPMEATLQNRASSLGILDRLPAELLHEVLKSLDFQSAIRFSHVSNQGKNMLCSLPAYRDVIKYAPRTLAALGQTKLLHLHSTSELHNALRNERCATCPEYGVYLFLPTCERCCWQCLRSSPTRRVISQTAAAKIFALSPKMVQQLPIMFSIPGTYGIAYKSTQISYKSTQISYRLVSASAVKELVISTYGSPENAIEAIIRRTPIWQTIPYMLYLMARDPQAIFPHSTCLDDLMMLDQGNRRTDPYFGMALIPFPSLTTPDIVELGLWCKGCEWTYKQYRGRRLPAYIIANMVPAECDPDLVLLDMARRAYSRIRLSAHLRHCYGAQQLLVISGGAQRG